MREQDTNQHLQSNPEESFGMRLVGRIKNMAEDWEKQHPDSVYAAYMNRFDFIRSQLPPEIQNRTGMGWLEFDYAKDAAGKEIGARVGDLFWNVTFGLVSRDWRSPLYQSALTKAAMPDIVGSTVRDGRNRNDQNGEITLNIAPAGFQQIGS